MVSRPDGLKVSGTERICFRVGSSKSYAVSSDFVRAGLLNCNKSAGLIDSEVEIASCGNGYGKSYESSNLEKTHGGRFKEWLESASKHKSTRRTQWSEKNSKVLFLVGKNDQRIP